MLPKTKLKPINQKKPTSGSLKPVLTTSNTGLNQKQNLKQQIKKKEYEKPVISSSTVKKNNRPSTAIQLYECDDFQMPMLEEDNYFESQLQKSIKTEIMSKTQKPQPKNQVVLPKLESDMKVKQLKELEKQMDLEMSRILIEQMDEMK